MRLIFHASLFFLLTVLTQIVGLAWVASRLFKRPLWMFAVLYVSFSVASVVVAPQFGRVALPCFDDGPLQMRSHLFCVLSRHYVVPEMRSVALILADTVNNAFPGTVTSVLDGSFPFLDGFPLLPHLSHDDGKKLDLAFYYEDETGYLPGRTPSPFGYFAFEDGPTDCKTRLPTLRWDLKWLQPIWLQLDLDENRLRTALNALAADPRVGKILVEPHLVDRLGAQHPKIRFQGCRAARHDDHIHFQLD